jgi:hypothetical protein
MPCSSISVTLQPVYTSKPHLLDFGINMLDRGAQDGEITDLDFMTQDVAYRGRHE